MKKRSTKNDVQKNVTPKIKEELLNIPNIHESSKEFKQNSQENSPIVQNIINIPKSKWSWSDTIASLSLCVSGILAIFTYSLYKTTVKEAKTSVDMLTQTTSMFEKQNEPYLDMAFGDIFKIDKNDNLIFSFQVYNMASEPVKIIGENCSLVYYLSSNKDEIEKSPFRNFDKKLFKDNYYISTKDKSPITVLPSQYKITKDFLNDLKIKNKYLYIIFEYEYINYLNDKKRLYKCVINVTYNGYDNLHYRRIAVDNSDE